MDGNNILGHLLGSKDASRNLASQASASTGIDAGLIKKALPLLAGLAMGVVGKSQNSDGGQSGGLPDILGSLGSGDFGVDDMLDIAKKFF